MPDFAFRNLSGLLRRPITDPVISDFLSPDEYSIERDEYYGSIDYPLDGVEVVLKESPWVVPEYEIEDARTLHVSAFHLHREGHDGYSGYLGPLLGGTLLNDTEEEIIQKIGQPESVGGGGFSALLKKEIPFWMKYKVEGDILNLQIDKNRRVEMATFYAPDIKQ